MEKDYILNVIKMIKENPQIHYRDIQGKINCISEKDSNRLYALLYALKEQKIVEVTGEDPHINGTLLRGIEKSRFITVDCNLDEKLSKAISFWKLGKMYK
jgi:hypothetical protein